MSSRGRTASGGTFERAMASSVFQNPDLLTAWATAGLFATTLLVGSATCFLIWTGIREMRRSSDQRARDRRETREADLRRHEEALEEGRRLHQEAQEEGRRRHEEAMAALKALIERTVPPLTSGAP